jgi:hypothetical protein
MLSIVSATSGAVSSKTAPVLIVYFGLITFTPYSSHKNFMLSISIGIPGIIATNATANGGHSEKLLLALYAFIVTLVVVLAVTRLYRLQ